MYAVAGDQRLAVKIYTTADRAAREQKISAMIRAGLASKTPLVAFPTAIVRTRDGSFAGFVMRLIGGHKPLHELYSPGPRKQHFPQAGYQFLARTATNIARAVASVHQSGCVIGDINHSSMLVSAKAVVALIDADSFQVSDGQNRYLCKVGVPEYTPPELQGKTLASVVRTPNHDAFGLAVVLFQILFMGRHPFVGTVRRGDIPPIHEAISQHRYVYAHNRDVGMDQPPGTPAVSDFFPRIANAFEEAFSGAPNKTRPTAAQWVEHLEALEAVLSRCSDNPLHHAPRDASDCAWCEMENALGTVLFLPHVPNAQLSTTVFDPGAGGFNIEVVWSQIAAIKLPNRASLLPRVNSASLEPSADVKGGRPNRIWHIALRIVAVTIAVVVLVAIPQAWILCLPLGAWGVFAGSPDVALALAEMARRRYVEAETNWMRQLADWQRRCGLDDIEALLKNLQEAKQTYESLSRETQAEIERYRSQRRAKQLEAYLDAFQIRNARIEGVGPGRQATLASFGIDSAADITFEKVLAVPGFGDLSSRRLVDWRKSVEKRFVYNEAKNDVDRREIARINNAAENKAATLRRKLLAGRRNIAALAQRTEQARTVVDPVLNKANAQREQAKVDLHFLGVAPPAVAPVATAMHGALPSAAQSASPSSIPASVGTSPNCPRCSTRMVRRVARRGAHAGHAFWGCSRYPRCKGARNI